jgi:ligand-binding sensor domain-containing protein/signal transduction histidine kinase
MKAALALITTSTLLLLGLPPVPALDRSLDVSQYAHTARTVRDGFSLGNTRDNVPIRLLLIEGKDIRFSHLSTEQGLSQSRVDHMLQDRRGFIWIGTLNGLSRYDGYRFETYKPDPNNPNSLGGLRVFALFEDRSGILWIGVDQELDRFDPVTETFTHFRADPDNRDSPSGYLEHMTQDRDGMLWLATRNGLDRLDPASGRFTHYRNDPNDPHSLTSNDVRFVLEDRQGTLWVANGAGLDAFDSRTGRVLRNYPSFQQPPLDRLLEDRSGTLWASATRGGGLASLDRKTGVFTRYTWFGGWPGTPGVRGCAAILEDQRGMLWLATKPDGLVRFDRARRLFTKYRNNPVNPASLNNNDALSLLEDREGGIWVGTNGGGVNRFPSEPLPFTVFRNEPGNPNSLEEGNVLSVFEDGRGILWIGTTSQLNRLDKKTGQYTFYRHDPANSASIATGVVRATVEDRAGYLWFGTWGGGLNRFDRGTGRFKAYRHDPADAASLSHDYVLSLLLDHEGSLWAGTDDGLNRLDARTGHFTHFRWKTGSIESRWYPVLAEGADGSIWMGTYTQGLQRLDVRTGEIVAYKYDPKVPGSLSNNQVHALCVDHAGTLWVGTQNGLDRFDSTTRKFTAFGERDGLPNNAVEGILEDSAGNLWLSTSNGLSRFNPQTQVFKNYFADGGLAGDEFNDFSVYYKSASGEMYFGGVNGVTAFYPEKVVDSRFVPPVVLTDFLLFNNPVRVGEESVLRKSISYTDALTLSHQQNIFSIEFSSLSYPNPRRNRYRYMLEPLEKTWNEVGSNQRLVTYTTLPPGRYTFRVQGSSSSGAWNVNGVSVVLTILPPWYQTNWFRALCVAALLVLVWALYQLRLRQLARQFNMRLEERVGERTRIARDLHDTLLQSFLGVMLHFQTGINQLPENPSEARTAEARKTLEKTMHQAKHAIVEGREAIQRLRSSVVETNDLALAMRTLGEELAADANSVEFQVHVEGMPRDLHPILRDEVYRITGEGIRNAFRHADAQRIEVEIRYDEQQLRLRIRDNGKGIDPKLLSDDGRPGHFGLRGMRERAKLLGGKLTVWSEVDSGTEVELSIPAARAYTTATDGQRMRLTEKFLAKLSGRGTVKKS